MRRAREARLVTRHMEVHFMRRRITVVTACIAATVGAPTAVAGSAHNGHPPYLGQYSHAYYAAKHAGQPVGRNIRRFGVRTSSGVRAAREAEVRRSTATLRAMLPPPALSSNSGPAPTGAQANAAQAANSANSSSPSSGGYCGAYQFDQQTWNSVGMSGSPCGASPAQQDAAAQRLQQQRGNQPWPVCGQGGASLAQIRQCENGGSYR